MDEKRGMGKKIFIILMILLVLFLGTAIYFTFFFSYSCNDLSCFKSHQEKCTRTEYIKDSSTATWLYKIKGKEKKDCKIEVKVLQMKKGSLDKIRLEGKSMDCYLPLGSLKNPEADLSFCNGVLKEEIQNLMIKKLYSYVIDNIGEISKELNKELTKVV